jgi:hypothetical protein
MAQGLARTEQVLESSYFEGEKTERRTRGECGVRKGFNKPLADY